jgi:phage gp46-like protein
MPLRLAIDPETGEADLVRGFDGRLEEDGGLSAIAITTFLSEADAQPGDPIHPSDPHRGWWGDAFAEPGARRESRHWLRLRGKVTGQTAREIQADHEEAAEPLIATGLVEHVEIEVERAGLRRIHERVRLFRPEDLTPAFEDEWSDIGGL